MSASLFDRTKLDLLKDYQDESGQQLCASLVKNFLSATPAELDQLEQSANEGGVAFTRLAHTLKSTAALLGGTELAQICADLENKKTDAETRRAEVHRARQSFLTLKDALLLYISSAD